MTIGFHILGELYGVDPHTLSYVENIEPIIQKISQDCQFNVLTSSFHQFKPYGVTGFLLLAESHLSIHTWPEEGFLAVDIFSCSSREQAIQAFERLVQAFDPIRFDKRILDRGIAWKNQKALFSKPYKMVKQACGNS